MISAYQIRQQKEDEFLRQENQKIKEDISKAFKEHEECKQKLAEEQSKAPVWASALPKRNPNSKSSLDREVLFKRKVAERQATIHNQQQVRQNFIVEKLEKELGQDRFDELQQAIGKAPGGFARPNNTSFAPINNTQQVIQTQPLPSQGNQTPLQTSLVNQPYPVSAQTQQNYQGSQAPNYPVYTQSSGNQVPNYNPNMSQVYTQSQTGYPLNPQSPQYTNQRQTYPPGPTTEYIQNSVGYPQYTNTNPNQQQIYPQYQLDPQHLYTQNPAYTLTNQPYPQYPVIPEYTITPEERKWYDYYFSLATQGRGDYVTMADANFFRLSNLNNDHLIEIWRLASLGDRKLTKDQFYVALRLISLAQSNEPIVLALISKQLPLPQISLPQPTQ